MGSKIDAELGSAARLQLFRNEGSSSQPSYRLAQTLELTSAYHQSPALADLDADGDTDLLLGTWNQGVLYFRNEGSRTALRFVQDTTLTIDPSRASNTMPALGDIDGDGDLDLLVGEASGEVNYYRNEGTRQQARFVLVTEKLGDIDAGRRSAPTLVDLDGDGLLDLVVGREDAGVSAFRNAGTRSEPRFEPVANWTLPLPPFAAPVFADLTGEGRSDLLSGGTGGGLVFYRNSVSPSRREFFVKYRYNFCYAGRIECWLRSIRSIRLQMSRNARRRI